MWFLISLFDKDKTFSVQILTEVTHKIVVHNLAKSFEISVIWIEKAHSALFN